MEVNRTWLVCALQSAFQKNSRINVLLTLKEGILNYFDVETIVTVFKFELKYRAKDNRV